MRPLALFVAVLACGFDVGCGVVKHSSTVVRFGYYEELDGRGWPYVDYTAGRNGGETRRCEVPDTFTTRIGFPFSPLTDCISHRSTP